MRHPWANTILLGLLLLQLLTGFGGLISGSNDFSWVLWLHGLGGYALAGLLYWKGAIIFNVFKQPWQWTLARVGFIALTLLVLLILLTGWWWSYAGQTYLFGFSLIVLHGFLACALLGLLIWHTIAKWWVWRIPAARNRRTFLRLTGLGLVGLTARSLAESAKAASDLPGTTRRFTGSYETGSFTGVFPATSWLTDYPDPIAIESWRLTIEGAAERSLSFTYDELLQLIPHTQTALLDCTGGFYTTQEWTGVPLAYLLEQAGVQPTARSVTVQAISGYGRRFPLSLARTCLLATHVAGQPLTHDHGFPMRLVVPGRRGFDWVKWVTTIRLNESSHLWQPPVPLQ